MAATADTSKPYFPLTGVANDGWTKETEATATCFCGAVQLAFVSQPPLAPLFPPLCLPPSPQLTPPFPLPKPTEKPGLVDTFVCNCTDCRKITASMFASNFIVQDTHLRHVRGRQGLKAWSQDRSIASGHAMTNHFCGTCGTLMYRVGAAFPGTSILRIGTVDDFSLHETRLRPRVEQFTKDRVSWFSGVEGAVKCADGYFKPTTGK
ncbi:Mss4-like protein [Hypoxylon sp. FL1150]|nr:Mss4-like protein [Hypoxylon sp. FL1150]